jgi:hypothetical protein
MRTKASPEEMYVKSYEKREGIFIIITLVFVAVVVIIGIYML